MPRVVALAGGVGGARLAHGLALVLAPGDLAVVVNTGDDAEFHGLLVSPDHDTVLYTLAGLADRERGWGLAGETWAAAGQLARLGEPTWFQLGDRDLALHMHRTRRLRDGERPTTIALDVAARLGVATRILPMADEPVRTRVRTADGWLSFQDWFVRLRAKPPVLEVTFDGVEAGARDPRDEGSLLARRRDRDLPLQPPRLDRSRSSPSPGSATPSGRPGGAESGSRRSPPSSAGRPSAVRRTGCSLRSARRSARWA